MNGIKNDLEKKVVESLFKKDFIIGVNTWYKLSAIMFPVSFFVTATVSDLRNELESLFIWNLSRIFSCLFFKASSDEYIQYLRYHLILYHCKLSFWHEVLESLYLNLKCGSLSKMKVDLVC